MWYTLNAAPHVLHTSPWHAEGQSFLLKVFQFVANFRESCPAGIRITIIGKKMCPGMSLRLSGSIVRGPVV